MWFNISFEKWFEIPRVDSTPSSEIIAMKNLTRNIEVQRVGTLDQIEPNENKKRRRRNLANVCTDSLLVSPSQFDHIQKVTFA